MRKKVPPEIASAFDAKTEAAFKARDDGDLETAESLFLQAWDLLPEPVYEYDFYPQVFSRKIVEFYRDSNRPTILPKEMT